MRRLSTVPTSQHGSPRSSVGPDSPSVTFSHGSTAPILHSSGSPAQSTPNKLVKRTTSGRMSNGDTPTRTGSRSQVPTLRRPATSHQRSVTLQQQFRQESSDATVSSLQQPMSPGAGPIVQIPNSSLPSVPRNTHWRPYFESRVTKMSKERHSGWSTDGTPESYPTSKRILLPDASVPAPTLLKPATILASNAKAMPTWKDTFPAVNKEADTPIVSNESAIGTPGYKVDTGPHKRVRRSLSINFSSPKSWIPRSGSIRGAKNGGNTGSTGRRNVSEPTPVTSGRVTLSHGTSGTRRKDIMDPSIYQNQGLERHESPLSQNPFTTSQSTARSRNSSSPLPPLSRLSSFNLDLARVDLSSSSSSGPLQVPNSPITTKSNVTSPSIISPRERFATKQATPVIIHQHRSPRPSEMMGSDRASTLIGSDYDNKGFTSGDEDDMDFQSDTVFDSFRTGATGSVRSRNPPLEMMFDESPPSAGSKPKSPITLDLASTLTFREPNDRILEEDEGMVTPIKDRRVIDKDRFHTPTRTTLRSPTEDVIRSSPPSFSLSTRDFARLSIEDDDDDEDWTRDDENIDIGSSLSPASRPPSSVNSRRVSPALRTVLAEVTRNGSSFGNLGPFDDRPRSVFDWSEPLISEKSDLMGNSSRPKTVHGKQAGDGRGGRAVGRKGPSALHIRSQSVPVVPDVAGHREHTKLAPKFGTWGLGAKGVSEDWDNDFDFMDMEEEDSGDITMSNSAMIVPPAIQASQANVVGHVGQIREICLLVEDLKRLRGQAREQGILDGPSANLWRDAEGIIALAIPDEEDQTLSPPQSPDSAIFSYDVIGDRYRDGGFDSDVLGGDGSNGEFVNQIEQRSVGAYENTSTRRRSVFSTEDDIFGGGVPAPRNLGGEQIPSTGGIRHQAVEDSTTVARSVMERIHQHRAISDPLRSEVADKSTKMPFDTTSLRDLVQRANHLRSTLAEIVRNADGTASPYRSPMPDRDSSPAFTRVFTDPLASPPKHLTRTQSNNSILSNSIDASPTRALGQRMHMMTVV
jgi:hypothetical protein